MKLNKFVSILICVALAFNLVIQLVALISLTKTKLGKLIRKSILKGSCMYMDDSIDVVQEKMPEWEKKLETISGSIEQ